MCYHRGVTMVPDWPSFDPRWVHLGASWHWHCRTWRKFLTVSHRSHPLAPLLPEPGHANPTHTYRIYLLSFIFFIFYSQSNPEMDNDRKSSLLGIYVGPFFLSSRPKQAKSCPWVSQSLRQDPAKFPVRITLLWTAGTGRTWCVHTKGWQVQAHTSWVWLKDAQAEFQGNFKSR